MADPTIPKVTRMQTDLDKMVEKLVDLRTRIGSMTSDPRGGDMEIARLLKLARDEMEQASKTLRSASNMLQAPLDTLVRRKRAK